MYTSALRLCAAPISRGMIGTHGNRRLEGE